MNKWIKLIVIVIVSGVIVGAGINGCSHEKKLQKQVAILRAQLDQKTRLENATNQIVALPAVATTAENPVIAARTNATTDYLQKQITSLQTQLAEMQRANEALSRKVVSPIVPSPNPEIMQAINSNNGDKSMIAHIWTGIPAVIHEINELNSAKTPAPTATQTDTNKVVVPTMSPENLAAQTELNKEIADLEERIQTKKVDILLCEDAARRDNTVERRNIVRQHEIEQKKAQLSSIQKELNKLQMELQKISSVK